MYYRHKPLPVRAWYFSEECEESDLPQWLREIDGVKVHLNFSTLRVACIVLGVGHSVPYAMPGEWIVQYKSGELFPYKPYIFFATYEKLDATEKAPQ